MLSVQTLSDMFCNKLLFNCIYLYHILIGQAETLPAGWVFFSLEFQVFAFLHKCLPPFKKGENIKI